MAQKANNLLTSIIFKLFILVILLLGVLYGNAEMCMSIGQSCWNSHNSIFSGLCFNSIVGVVKSINIGKSGDDGIEGKRVDPLACHCVLFYIQSVNSLSQHVRRMQCVVLLSSNRCSRLVNVFILHSTCS